MTDIILSFPTTSPRDATTGRKPIQVWMDVHLVATIDAWRSMQPDNPPRTEAMRRLAALGLAGELLDASKPAKRRSKR
jgi:hypothetical protein